MKATAFGDTHMLFPEEVGAANFGFYTGDYESGYNKPEESEFIAFAFIAWYRKQPFRRKLLVPGNHDLMFWNDPVGFRALCQTNGIYLLDNEIVEMDGLRIFGSPYYYTHKHNSNPRNVFPEPGSFDILLTHVPPFGIMDFAQGKMENIGSQPLREYVQANKPKLHLFGHCHESYNTLCRPFMNVALRSKNNKKLLATQPVTLDISDLVENK